MYKYFVSILITGLVQSSFCQAQYKLDDLDLSGNLYSWYDAAIGKNNTGILIGEYQPIFRNSKNTHQFYISDQWTYSLLSFRNQTYDSIALLYDLDNDVLVIRHPTDFRFHSQPIKVTQSQVAWFRLHDHTFKYYDENEPAPDPGFYDELFAGENIKLFVKRIKNMETSQTSEYISADKYYFSHQGKYYRIGGRITFLRIFKENRPKIRRYAISNRLKIKTRPEYEANMIQLSQYINDLLTERP